jgi:hypothetical protein
MMYLPVTEPPIGRTVAPISGYAGKRGSVCRFASNFAGDDSFVTRLTRPDRPDVV